MNQAPSHEVELKFQVPPAALAAVRRALGPAAVGTRLHALYADTLDGALAQAGLALRLRREGRTWVQTLKGRGDGLMQRLEHEVRLPAQRGAPQLDPARHAGTAAGALLERALQGAALVPQYGTDIHRSTRVLRRGGARIEIALDEGHISAGGARLPVCELEFELLAGPREPLLALAASWVRRHGLWLDVRSKSERGQHLQRGLAAAAPVHAQALQFDVRADAATVFAATVASALQQALPNAAELAAGQGTPEHLHQLRVGLRRLRSALRLLGHWSPDPAAAQALEAALQPQFAQLGAARDEDVVEAVFGAELRAAGAPPLAPAAARGVDVAPLLRAPAFSLAMLQALALLAAALAAAAAANTEGGGAARDAAARVLRQAWRAALRDAPGFEQAPLEVQHRVRKRLKRLRYGTEFLLPLWPEARSGKLMRAQRAALEALGAVTDLALAQAHYRERAAEEGQAWFALGWLAAERPRLLRRCVKTLRRLANAPRFWN